MTGTEELAEAVSHATNMWQRVKWQQPHYCSIPTECMDCNCPADKAEGRVVGEVTGGYGPICNECWSIFLRQETVLSEREADVAALRDMGISPMESANILDIEKTTVHTYLRRIHTKIEKARRTVDEIEHLSPENAPEGKEID